MRARALFSLVGALIAAIALVSASGAATTKAQTVAKIDVSTRASVIHYLRSIHVNPKGLVIQRGKRNYAGAHCPGKRWGCTTTKHPVVQIAKAGGANRFRCSTASCAVVQISNAAAAGTNTAKCIKIAGLTQSCTINQSSAGQNNVAVIYQAAIGALVPKQTASMTASITQQATGSSNTNTACVSQNVALDGSTISTKAVNVALEAHQTVTITQDSSHGGNSAQSSATVLGTCDAAHPLTQGQLLNSIVAGRGAVTQNENAAANGPNVSLDIEQNQSSGFKGTASGPNSAVFSQTSNLQAVADTPTGPVSQTQSSPDTALPYSGLVGTLNQDSTGISTAQVTQTEKQCEDAATSGLTSCKTAPGNADFNGTYALHQTQYGPEGIGAPSNPRGSRVHFVHKGVGSATQTGNASDTFTLTQSSKQDNDTGSGQTNVVQGDCHTDGSCTSNQSTTVNGSTTSDTQSGQDVNSTINCTGSSCTATPPPMPTITSGPDNPSNSSSAAFQFTDTDSTVTFECQIDGGGYSPCTSPTTYDDLGNGSHTFYVKAKNGTGQESDPATYPWTINTAQFTWDGAQLTATNVDVAEFGYGGMRDNGTGTIDVSGVSGTVLRAYLYWNGPTSVPDPDSNADVTFNGNSITGTNIGTASDDNWDYLNGQSYRADVTSLVSGNGIYSLSDFTNSNANVNGAALIVFYDDGNSSNDRDVVLWNGDDSNVTPGPPYDTDGWDETLTNVPYPGSGSATLDLVVSDGQYGFDDAAVVVNGSTVAAAGPIFSGESVPANATQTATDEGSLWDIEPFDITSLLSTGDNSVEITTGVNADYLSLVVAMVSVPASAPILVAPRAAPVLEPNRPAPTLPLPRVGVIGGGR